MESFFSNVKHQGAENLPRGTIRVRGGMKTGPLTLKNVGATNFRLAERRDLRKPRPTQKKRGRLAKQQLASYAEVAPCARRTNSPPAA